MNRSISLNEAPAERRLAAILAADVVGYSRLMGEDEVGTLRALKAMRGEVLDPTIASCRGRIVKTTGDGVLVEFASVVDAVVCAVTVQRDMLAIRAGARSRIALTLRIGVNIGDIIIDGEDIFGDGVNLASRLELICDPGGVTISRAVHEQVHDKLSFPFADLGERSVKNIVRPVRVFELDSRAIARLHGEPPPRGLAPVEEDDAAGDDTTTRAAKPRWKKWRSRLILLIIAAFLLWHREGVRHAVTNFMALVTTTPGKPPAPAQATAPKPAELKPLPPPIFIPATPGSGEKPAPASPTGEASPPGGANPPGGASPPSNAGPAGEARPATEPSQPGQTAPPGEAKPADGADQPLAPPLQLHPQD